MVFDSKRVKDIHIQLVQRHKIEPGYRDESSIDSILCSMDNCLYGKEIYGDVFLKAACMFEGIIRLHPFIDGNKRTALACVQEYLMENSIIFILPYSAVRFSVKLAKINCLEPDCILLLIHNISKWLRYRSATLDELDRIKEIMQEEERLIRNILEIGKRRRDTSMMERVLDSWLAKDIYPGYDISPKDLINFQNDRYKLVLNFLKEEFTRTK